MADSLLTTVVKWRPRGVHGGIVCALGAIGLVVQVLRQLSLDVPYDFQVYWHVSGMLANGETDLYGWTAGRHHWVFLYPPFFAAGMAALSRLDMTYAYWLWTLAQIPLMAITLVGLWKLIGARQWNERIVVCAAIIALLFVPLHRNLIWGQMNLLLLALTTWGLRTAVAGRPRTAGALAALAVQVKLLPVTLIPVMLFMRRWKAALYALVTLLILCAAPVAWLTPRHGLVPALEKNQEMHMAYVSSFLAPRAVSRQSAGIGSDGPDNLAVSAVLNRLGHGRGVPVLARAGGWIGAAVGLFMFGLGLLLTLTQTDHRRVVFSAGLTLGGATFGQVTLWHHHLLWLAIPVSMLIALDRMRILRPWTLPATVLLLVLINVTLVERLPVLVACKDAGVTTGLLLAVWVVLAWTAWTTRNSGLPSAPPAAGNDLAAPEAG